MGGKQQKKAARRSGPAASSPAKYVPNEARSNYLLEYAVPIVRRSAFLLGRGCQRSQTTFRASIVRGMQRDNAAAITLSSSRRCLTTLCTLQIRKLRMSQERVPAGLQSRQN